MKQTDISNAPVVVPGDLSSAAFLLVAAAITDGSDLTVRDVGLNPTRSGILEILRAFGARVEVSKTFERCGEPVGTVRVRAGDRRPLTVSTPLSVAAIDELPLVGVLGAFAEGTTEVKDAAELRHKESDRVAAVVDGLRAMGASVEPSPDGFTVRGTGGLAGAQIDPRGDHRIAMAFAVAALAAHGDTTVDGWQCVGVSYPGFEETLEHVAVR